jgi:serine/threonine protein kinase
MSTSDLDAEARVDGLVELWENARAKGHDLPVEELCRDCPELIDEVREKIQDLGSIAWLGSDAAEATLDFEAGPGGLAGSPSATPRVLAGRYQLEQELGRGTFGIVHRAIDLELNRLVAVKIHATKRRPVEETAANFRAEAQRVAKLNDPGIVAVHDVGVDGEVAFIVTDLVEGSDLRREARASSLSYAECARVVADAAAIIHHAHEKGILHCDIKPANILLDGTGRVFVTDFGISLNLRKYEAPSVLMGKIPYMAPELLNGKGYSRQTEVYALGVVLYELVVGKVPFRSRTVQGQRELLEENISTIFMQTLDPRLPPRLTAICRRCLAWDPADRYQRAGELAEDLRAFLRGLRQGRIGEIKDSERESIQALTRGKSHSFFAKAGIATLQGILMLTIGAAGFLLGELYFSWLENGNQAHPFPVRGTSYQPSAVSASQSMLAPSADELARLAINLLRKIDLKSDGHQGRWSYSGKRLIGEVDETGPCRIDIAMQPEGEYILRVALRRKRAEDAVVFGLTSEHGLFTVVIDERGGTSGLSLIDGQPVTDIRNPSRFQGAVIPLDCNTKIICTVRKNGVHVLCNGFAIIDWCGDLERLSLPPFWKPKEEVGLFLGFQSGSIEYQSVELIDLAGEIGH